MAESSVVKWKANAMLLVTSVAFSILLIELVARVFPAPLGHPFDHNPIILRQSLGANVFQSDSELGHVLYQNSFVGVYQKRLMTLDEVLAEHSNAGGRIIINMGDSSTSGWNSDVVAQNTELKRRGLPIKSPLFTYPTYSDLMGDWEGFYVINAGVPGFSSLQGLRYFERILNLLESRGLTVEIVTFYFGNNDSAWNGNVQDRRQSLVGNFNFKTMLLIDKARQRFSVIPRVTVTDYMRNIEEMVSLAKSRDVFPIIIHPIVPNHWSPGRHSKMTPAPAVEFSHLEKFAVGQRLAHAKEAYTAGVEYLSQQREADARMRFEFAIENDFIVPRIKSAYSRELEAFAAESSVRLVNVTDLIPLDDRKFFIDYCHPILPANELIANSVRSAIPVRNK